VAIEIRIDNAKAETQIRSLDEHGTIRRARAGAAGEAMSHRYEREQAEAIKAVIQAGLLCRAVRAEVNPEVLDKKDRSPVTVADFGSQAIIGRSLEASFPDDPIIAEEDSAELQEPENAAVLARVVHHVRSILRDQGSDLSPERVCGWIDRGGNREYCDRFWTLDPIDGTKGFLRNEQYAIALALVVEGKVVVAALACPNLGAEGVEGSGQWAVGSGSNPADCRLPTADHVAEGVGVVFTAAAGQGAMAMPMDDDPGGGNWRALRVSDRDNAAIARFCESVEAGHSDQGDSAAIAAELGIASPPLRLDSQAKYGIVARGQAEIYLRMPTGADYREKIWDHAAGALIVEEAGGVITDINGRPLEFHHGRELTANRGIVATNGRFHGRVLEALNRRKRT
jgi:3'(2'), 5'-bisphosphate nucleotidase